MQQRAYLEVLGTGDSESLNYWNSNFLVVANDKKMLLDCGATIKYALADRQRSLADIDAVFISHIHGDHCFGLERLGFEARYVYQTRPTIYATKEVLHELWHHTLKGCMGHSAEGENSLNSFFDTVEVDGDFCWQGLNFKLFETTHTENKPCHGLHINNAVTWTSDTNAIDDLESHCCDIVLHDVCTVDHHPAHATFKEITGVYSQSMLKKILAIHYPDDIDEHRDAFLAQLGGIAEQGQRLWLS